VFADGRGQLAQRFGSNLAARLARIGENVAYRNLEDAGDRLGPFLRRLTGPARLRNQCAQAPTQSTCRLWHVNLLPHTAVLLIAASRSSNSCASAW